jgi:hypothetical protein
MRHDIQKIRRAQPRVEALEGKALLSTASVMHHIAPLVATAPTVAQAVATFSGTLTGSYSNIHIPGFGNILSYVTAGTLTGVGSTHLRGTLVVRGRSNRLLGQFILRNDGGAMRVNIFRTATLGKYTYQVPIAKGNDVPYERESGNLLITQTRNITAPFSVFGDATLTFTPS